MFDDFFWNAYRDNLNRKVVDTERYDIVEKPEYKKKRLQEEVDRYKRSIGNAKNRSDEYLDQARELEEILTKKEKELKEL
jgi:hypothetical protein